MHKGSVREWHDDEGWGVLDSPSTPGGCWAHFSHLMMTGYRSLTPGAVITFTFEQSAQDGFDFRSLQVWPASVDPGSDIFIPHHPAHAYQSSLILTLEDGTVLVGEQAHDFIRRETGTES